MSDVSPFGSLPVTKSPTRVFSPVEKAVSRRGAERSEAALSEEAFRRFQAGDEDAFAQVIELYQARMIGFLMLFTGLRETAEEIAQDAFLKLHKHRESIDGPSKILPWSMITAKRMAIRESGRLFRRLEIPVGPETIRCLGDAVQASQRDSRQREQIAYSLAVSLNGLKRIDRELVVLRFFSGLRIREIGEVLGMPIGTVGVKLRRALDRLAILLEKQGLTREDLL